LHILADRPTTLQRQLAQDLTNTSIRFTKCINILARRPSRHLQPRHPEQIQRERTTPEKKARARIRDQHQICLGITTLMTAVGIAASYKLVLQAKMLSRSWTKSSRYGIYTVCTNSLVSKVLIPFFDRISTPKPLLSSYNLESHYLWSS
jgi:hypothetical protein